MWLAHIYYIYRSNYINRSIKIVKEVEVLELFGLRSSSEFNRSEMLLAFAFPCGFIAPLTSVPTAVHIIAAAPFHQIWVVFTPHFIPIKLFTSRWEVPRVILSSFIVWVGVDGEEHPKTGCNHSNFHQHHFGSRSFSLKQKVSPLRFWNQTGFFFYKLELYNCIPKRQSFVFILVSITLISFVLNLLGFVSQESSHTPAHHFILQKLSWTYNQMAIHTFHRNRNQLCKI